MSDPILVDRLSRRNAASAREGLQRLDLRISQLYETIASQQAGMRAQQARIEALENRLNIQKVQMTGTGPSVVDDGND